MNRSFFLRMLGILALVTALAPLSYGKGKLPKPKPTPPPRHSVIASITSEALTVDTGGKNPVTYAITRETVFTFKGARVTLDALKPGMRVSVETSISGDKATAIAAEDPPKAPAKKK